ncbi:MAG TPA: hypothetical protein DCY07_02050 [Rhodospirillaceae bacterium]|nr:hypothetical protein [Rhodospirillaceae bacterium]
MSFLKPLSLVLVVSLQFLFVFLYLGHERAIDFWDYAMYPNMALEQWANGDWRSLWQSFDHKYNLLFTIPSLLTFSLFEPSRLVYILTNFVVYGVAYQLGAGFLLRQLFGFSWTKALLLAFAACSLVPFLWYPLLQGYPDMGGAAMLVFALALASGPTRRVKHALGIGALVGLSIVFRRHYAYAGMAVLLAGVLIDLPTWKTRGFWVHHALRGAAALATLVVIEPVHFHEMITTSYIDLYQSYERPALYFIHLTLAHAGLVLIAAAGAGLFFAWKGAATNRAGLAFVLLTAFLWLLIWVLGPVQVGQHYLVKLLPPVFIVGVVGLVVSLKNRSRFLLPLVIGGLIANAAYCFWLAPRFEYPSEPPSLSLFGTPRPPWVRTDIEDLAALAQYVASTTTNKDRIAVSGSSFVFNQDLVRAVYTDVLRDVAPAYRFIPAPESDGDQDPPLHVYAAANVYLVSTPAQFHLDPKRQKNVAALAAQFPPPASLEKLFTKDERVFEIQDGVKISVWRRKPWTPAALHEGLSNIRRLTPFDQVWVFTQGGTQSAFDPLPKGNAEKGSSVRVLLSSLEPSATLFLDQPLPVGHYRLGLTAQKQDNCPSLRIKGLLQTRGGETLAEQAATLDLTTSLYYFPFVVSGLGGAFLSLHIESAGLSGCLLALHGVRVETMNP